MQAEPAQPAAPAAVPQGELDRFERAFPTDVRAASQIFDSLAARRAGSAAPPRPDPLLSGLVGRLYLDRGWDEFALAYLRHADSPDVPQPQRVAALLALAEAQSRLGDRAAARETLRRLDGLSTRPDDRSRAAIAAARLAVGADPAAALALVQPVLGDGDATRRSHAEFIAAQAHSLLGDAAAAALAADRLWTTSAVLPAAEAAPGRAALLRAALAGERGDRDSLAAMSNVAGASAAQLERDIVPQLPVCGDRGVLPGDRVTFGLQARRGAAQELLPLSASRAAVVPVFVDALSRHALLRWQNQRSAGLTFTVRCRSVPSADYRWHPPRSGWADWFADRGLFFSLSAEPDLDGIAILSRRVGEMEERLGSDDPRLVAARLDLAERIAMRAPIGDVDFGEASRLHGEALAAMRRIGGVERALPPPEGEAFGRRIGATGSRDEVFRLARAELPPLFAAVPLEFAFGDLQMWFSQYPDSPNDLATTLVRTVLARFPEGSDDPRRRALLMRLAELQNAAGDRGGARASHRAAGVPAEACVMMDEQPTHVAGTISNEDYPVEALINDYAGSTAMDFAVTAEGRTTGRRLILSAPASIFDRITDQAFAGFTHTPARLGGRARACIGLTRRVLWELPEEGEELQPPDAAPPLPERI